MQLSRSPAALILLLSIVSFQAARAETVDARQLLLTAERALANTRTAAAAADGRLDSRKDFWTALDKMDAALRQVRDGLVSRDGRFFRGLEKGSAALGELRVVWSRGGVAEPRVGEGIRLLSSSFQLLRSGYGREAVRDRQGGELTEAEKRRFLRIQQAQRRFAESLRPLLARSGERGDAAMLAELRRMLEEAQRIAAAALTREAYLNALILGDIQRGEWEGNSHFAPADDRSEWLEAGAVVEELYVEQDVGHVFAVDLGSEATWARLDEPVEVFSPEEPRQETVEIEDEESEEESAAESEEALAEEEMEETGLEGSELELYEETLEGALEEAAGIEEEDLPVAPGPIPSEPKPEGKPETKPEAKPEARPEGDKSSDPPAQAPPIG